MTGPTVDACSERALIARIRARTDAAPAWLQIGIGDDAAVVRPERNLVDVITTDCAVEGVHFDRTFVPPDAIGHRALAVNLSDLAAMGAAPRAALLSLVLPPTLPLDDFDRLLDGFVTLARRHRTSLIGGNLSRSPGPLLVDVTALGTVHPRKVLRRAGARAGDSVYVSGALGAGRAGLGRCRAGAEGGSSTESDVARYLRPEPRVRLGMLLGRTGAASACMDLSDGLADGLTQISDASGVRVQIDAGLLPIQREARDWFVSQREDPVDAAIAGGDDYELLFTVPRRREGRLRGVARLVDVPLTKIGTVQAGSGVAVQLDGKTHELPPGFTHFGTRS